jgi:histone H3/H4
MKFISDLAMEKLFKKYSKNRVSNLAINELRTILENEFNKISLNSKKVAINSKRKTIKNSDIKVCIL